MKPSPLTVGAGLGVLALFALAVASSGGSPRSSYPTSNTRDDGRAWPVPAYVRVSSPFGWRTGPFTGQPQFHKGVDLAAAEGADVLAPISGRVAKIETTQTSGLTVWLHGRGEAHRLAHLSAAYVSEGQEVTAGQVIAAVGRTGQTTGPHLHWAVYIDGQPIDPLLL